MTGLEKILKTIEDQAQAEADEVIAQANQTAKEILDAAKLEAEKQSRRIAEKSASDVRAALSRAESAAALQEKKILLEAKQQIISNIILKARDSLANLPSLEFTEIILQMIKRYAHNKPGKIIFSATDKSRLSIDFMEKVNDVLANKPGAQLTISEENANITNGFLLIYGDIEENCSFDSLFSSEKEILQDKVNSLLFK